MQSVVVTPSAEGQVCKILNVLVDENPEDVYIVAEDSSVFDNDENIYVVNLSDLQRNIHRPEFTPQISITKNELTVIADNLEEYIKSWNI
ncbi:MAG: hypothetical protein ACXVA2_14840 [Mucilaginibacter sp.]